MYNAYPDSLNNKAYSFPETPPVDVKPHVGCVLRLPFQKLETDHVERLPSSDVGTRRIFRVLASCTQARTSAVMEQETSFKLV